MKHAPSRLPLVLLALALALPGCGAAADAPTSSAPAPSRPAADRDRPLTVAATDGGIGNAITASPAGIEELPAGPRRTRPDALEQGVGAGATCPDVETEPAPQTLAAVTAATVCLVNGERADAGLPPLTDQPKLLASALAHSLDMVTKQFFAHASGDGRQVNDRVNVTGYLPRDGAWTVGENLAWGTGTLATPSAIVASWMNSPAHRENILRPTFREAGLGVVLGNPSSRDGEGATYTMNFGAVTVPVVTVTTVPTGPTAQMVAAAKLKRALARCKKAYPKRAKARRACQARARRLARR